MRFSLVFVVSLSLVLGLSSCRDTGESPGLYGDIGELDQDRDKIRKLVDKLSAAKTMLEDPDAEAQYEEAKEELIIIGSGIQGVLFEELASSEDWGVRFGIVNVLSAIGTQRMVEPLISVLDDPEPQVAWMAMQTLQVVCNHYPIPEDEEAFKANGGKGLPPIPFAEDDGESQERVWREWHAINSYLHKESWEKWWDDNKLRVRIE